MLRPRFHGWWVVFCCFAMALYGWGLGFYGLSLYLVALTRIHGWAPATISAAITFYYVGGARAPRLSISSPTCITRKARTSDA